MSTSQDKSWKAKEQGEEAALRRVAKFYLDHRRMEQEQLAALRAEMDADSAKTSTGTGTAAADARDRDFEGGFGGQEDLEDRYATTSGEH
ncbi:hypothetical protein C8R43DRAFT_1121383 [Mycena crocata]|nr:hypothetical protein C8R43DRAFT_1121383 [Mycena crocata]